MSLQQSIEPQQLVKPAILIKIESIIFRFLEGEKYATAHIKYVNQDNIVVKTEMINLTEGELSTWGADDSVLMEIIKTKI